ncbi:hypothetical protein NQZ68_004811, partial [Dissostichus eleginoides]
MAMREEKGEFKPWLNYHLPTVGLKRVCISDNWAPEAPEIVRVRNLSLREIKRETEGLRKASQSGSTDQSSYSQRKERSSIQCAGCDAIQKGESDFEMESEDSDTAM